jgi:hypothetical protein
LHILIFMFRYLNSGKWLEITLNLITVINNIFSK